jgi:hypothetical protein
MAERIVVNFNHPIPVFPLPGSVLLPHGALPLHIFEPRYRNMVRDVIDSHGLIAMALFSGQPSDEQYLRGRPPVRSQLCVGYVEQYEQLDDGRYLIMLRGLCRARLVEEIETEEPYRLMRLQPTEVPPLSDEQLQPQREQLADLLNDPLLGQVEAVAEQLPWLDEPVPTCALIDMLITNLCDDVEQRYAMLSESDARQRAQWLSGRLQRIRHDVASGEGGPTVN